MADDALLPVPVPEKKNRILKDQLAEKVASARLRVVAVGHVGLVAEVDETLVVKIGSAVGPGRQGVVVKVVEREERLEDGEATDARIEDADGERREIARVFRAVEAESLQAVWVAREMRVDRRDEGVLSSGRRGGDQDCDQGHEASDDPGHVEHRVVCLGPASYRTARIRPRSAEVSVVGA